jgi:hypothetical protein
MDSKVEQASLAPTGTTKRNSKLQFHGNGTQTDRQRTHPTCSASPYLSRSKSWLAPEILPERACALVHTNTSIHPSHRDLYAPPRPPLFSNRIAPTVLSVGSLPACWAGLGLLLEDEDPVRRVRGCGRGVQSGRGCDLIFRQITHRVGLRLLRVSVMSAFS